ncbi:cilia- and flagella-associated protein 57-like [Hemibagrus wyckioides]|uniref:cilia- and flagella-associated protein 57-like n=1 Tax=Hemibagrus wyckioides TaxID=337641 RepID=UPI00266D1DA7|nr:cilia- and flagella-associated protein 57-like [Hemibagrus wyckioides]
MYIFLFLHDCITMAEKFTLEPHHIFGLKKKVNNNLHFMNDQTVIFPSGKFCVRYNLFRQQYKFFPVAKTSEGIQALAMSPNKHYLAASERGKQGTITIYNLRLKGCPKKRVLTGGKINVQEFVCMAFSSDSKYLLGQSGGPDWTLFYWDWEKNKVIAREDITRIGFVNQVSFNPKDSTQVCVNGKGVIKTFTLEHGILKQTRVFNMKTDSILCHTWMSEDCIVAGTETGNLLLLMVKSGSIHELGRPYERQMEYTGSDATVLAPYTLPRITAITQYSRGFICSGRPGQVCLYEETTEKNDYRKTMEISIPQDPCLLPSQAEITSLCMNPLEDILAITTDQGQIYHANLKLAESNKANFKFLFHSLHAESITHLSVCLSKLLVATCSKDNSVRVWNYETRSLELYKEFPEDLYCMALHPNGHSILVGFCDRLCLMNILVDKFQTVQEFPTGPYEQCVFNHDGNLFAAITGKVIHVYNVRTQKKVELTGHRKKVLSLNWSKDDSRLVSCGMDGTIYMWNIQTGMCESKSIQKSCIYTDVAFSSDSENVLAVGSDFKLKEFHDKQITMELDSDGVEYRAVCVTHSGKAVFVGTAAGNVRVMQYPLQEGGTWTEYQAHSSPITKMVITPGDRYLVTASEDGSLLIWTVTDNLGRLLCVKEMKYTDEVLCSKSYLEQKEKSLQEANTQVLRLEFEQGQVQNRKDRIYMQKLSELERKYLKQIEDLKAQNETLIVENEKQKALIEKMTKDHAKELEDEKQAHNQKLLEEYEKHCQMDHRLIQDLKADCKKKLHQQEESYHCAMKEMKKSHQDELLEQQAKFVETQKQIRASVIKKLDVKEMTEEFKTEMELAEEQVSEFENMKKNLLDRDADICKLKEDLKRMKQEVKKVKQLRKENETQNEIIDVQKKQILALLAKLEKFNKGDYIDYETLQHRFNQVRHERDHLKKLGHPKEIKQMQQKIEENKTVIKELKIELERSNTKNKELIEDLKKRLTLKDEELRRALHTNTLVERMKADIQRGSNFLDQPKMLKDHFMRLKKCYILKAENLPQSSIHSTPRTITKRVRRHCPATAHRILVPKTIMDRGEGSAKCPKSPGITLPPIKKI